MIQLHEIAGYLPYGLKRHCPSSNVLIHDYMPLDFIQSTIDMHGKFGWKPILRPMSDLIGQVGLPSAIEDYLRGKGVKRAIDLPHWAIQYLSGLNHDNSHYDWQDLIGRGLAVDINTLAAQQ